MKKISLIIILLFFSGCAWGDRRPTLVYTPHLTHQSKNGVVLKVISFEDERPIKDTVGYSRNGFGMRCAKVIPQNSVTEWVTNALKVELIDAGYAISDENTTKNIIEGMVYEIFCDTSFTYEGRAGLKVVLKQDGKIILEEHYSASKTGGVNWAATSESFAKTLDMVLQDVLKQVVFDINKKLLQK